LAEQETRHHASQVTEIDLSLPSGISLQVNLFDLDRHPDHGSLLSPDELKRAEGFVRPLDRLHFIARRSILRSLLVERCGLESSAIQLESHNRNKPVLPPEAMLRFNASRSGRWFAVVLTQSSIEPGVDVECLREISDVASVSQRILSSEECEALGEDFIFDSEFMLRIWTRKEAVLKSLGTGLGIDPSRATVPLEKNRIMNGRATVRNGSVIHDVVLLEPQLDFDGLMLSVGVAERLIDPIRE
jgi:4'-phosphopantetheinyl transferase